ncbi:Ig-like domain-containing protein [bacterium]|nr:Ig-like domain-containing protein [bacterium]
MVHRFSKPVVLMFAAMFLLVACKPFELDNGSSSNDSTNKPAVDPNAISVQSLQPTNGSAETSVDTEITVTFDKAPNADTVLTNTADNTCVGLVQVSAVNFSACIILQASSVSSMDNRSFVFKPVDLLETGTTYKIKVAKGLNGVSSGYQIYEFTTVETEAAPGLTGDSFDLEGVIDSTGRPEASPPPPGIGEASPPPPENEDPDPADGSAPEVVVTTPNDAETGVPVGSSISVTFNETMDVTSVIGNTDGLCSGSVQVSDNDFSTCLPMLSSVPSALSDDSVFVFSPAVALSLSNRYKIRITPAARDISGNPLAGTYTSPSGFSTPDISVWSLADGGSSDGMNYSSLQDATVPHIATFNSKLYASWQETNGVNSQIRISVFNNDISSPGFNFIDGGGMNGINFNPAAQARDQHLVEFGNRLVVTWVEDNGTADQIRVAVFDGNDVTPGWIFVDGSGLNGLNKNAVFNAANPTLAVHQAKLYIAWTEFNGTADQIRLAVYNGDDGAPSWSLIDGDTLNGINKDPAQSGQVPQLAVFANKLYVSWQESKAGIDQIRAAVYNGDDLSPAWNRIDGNALSGLNYDDSQNAQVARMAVYQSKLYLTWQENKSTKPQIRVAVYNGDDAAPAWSFADGAGSTGINYNSGNEAENPRLTVLNTGLYAIWQEKKGSDFQTRITLFNGDDHSPTWDFVDGNGLYGINFDTGESVQTPLAVVHQGTLFAVWSEWNGTATQIRLAVGQ